MTLEDLKRERLADLEGEYIIVGRSKYDSDTPMYLQDMKYVLRTHRNWTKFKDNAKVFDDALYARQTAAKFPNMQAHVEKKDW